MRRTPLVVVALILTACASANASPAAQSPQPPPNYQNPEILPPTSPGTIPVPADKMLKEPFEGGGVSFEAPPADSLVGVTAAQVLKTVNREPGPDVSVTLALATTDALKDISTGYRPIDHRLVWWVRQTNTCLISTGGGVNQQPSSPVPEDKDGCPLDANHEDNALVDPITGVVLVGYTYR